MKKIVLEVESGKSEILVGESIDTLSNYLPDRRIIVITDSNISKYYSSKIENYSIIEIKAGEEYKTIDTVSFIIDELIKLEADRSIFILGFGGGVVCDIAGLVASVYMRGVRFGFVSTSLLSMVDASVGGKNGVNVGGLKNIFGVFNQPEFVICDVNLLQTLPENEYLSGFAEIIKCGLIADETLIKYIESNYEKLLIRDKKSLTKLISDSVMIKTSIVENDEKESGSRRILNFGHTIGHAIEKSNNILHGEAVSIGIIKALKISVDVVGLDPDIVQRVERLLNKFNLPMDIVPQRNDLISKIKLDKKREDSKINFVLLQKLGKTKIVKLNLSDIEKVL